MVEGCLTMECGKGRRRGLLGGFILAWFFISDCIVAARDREHYDTAYECEGKTLKIKCKEGEFINLIRANYGRFSITICNEHGNTDWSVNCMSQESFRVLWKRCNQKQNCSIIASTSHFGDPCPNTHKYLEAHYQCMPVATTTTTSRPSPPWLITSQPNLWSTTSPSVKPPSVVSYPPAQLPAITTVNPFAVTSISPVNSSKPLPVEDNFNKIPYDPSKNYPGPAVVSKPVEMTTPTTTTTTTIEYIYNTGKTTRRPAVVSTSVPYIEYNSNNRRNEFNQQICLSRFARKLQWNATRVNDEAVQSCPGGASGIAKWKCVSHKGMAVWERDSPDLSGCISLWLTSLEKRLNRNDTILLHVSTELLAVINDLHYGGDILITPMIIENMADRMKLDIKGYPNSGQTEDSVTELLQSVIKTGSKLLEKTQMASWKDLSHKEQIKVATSLLSGLESNAFLLAEILQQEKIFIQEVENILIEVRVLRIKSSDNNIEVFPSKVTGKRWTPSNVSIELTKKSLLESSEDGIVRVVFMAFDRLEEILRPYDSDESYSTINTFIGEENFDEKEEELQNSISNKIINSKVISASLGKGRHIPLSEPVKIYFKHLITENVTKPTCVYWNYNESKWSPVGCRVSKTNKTHTVCECAHLTNFAVLMDVHAVKLDIAHQVALQIITYIGCIISVVCLVLAIMTFQLFRGLKSDRTTIHKNLCVCLLIAEVLFVCGIGQTDQRIICGVVAGLLHFFFLCAFAWMFLEGFQLYVMLIEVFEAEKSRLRWYYLVAYGGPLLVVAISCIIDPRSYGTDRYCWLRADNYFIFSFVGPVILVILANLVFLSMAIYMMCRHANTTVSMKSKEHSRLASARAWLRGAIILVFLLGLTWTFGLLYLNQESVIMAYIFTVLNSLQGLFIFVFHCVQNEKVRKEYRKFIRRHSWLPKCLRCSKTVTGSSGGSSGTGGTGGVNGGKDFSSHNTSSNPSAPTTDSSGLSPHAATNNISFKSYSRDSGHGGSEQEESPRTHNTMTLGHSGRTSRDRRQMSDGLEIGGNGVISVGNNRPSGRRAASPYNHTYTEIRDGTRDARDVRLASSGYHQSSHGTHCHLSRGLVGEDDPVYEEIERGSAGGIIGVVGVGNGSNSGVVSGGIGEIQVSDMSDEDGRRQSDMSRQSSRSYGDHRPLIPYSPANDRNLIHYGQSVDRNVLQYDPSQYSPAQERTLNACWEKLRRQQAKYELGEMSRISNSYGIPQQDHNRTVAVLDGHTVVCHLQPQTDNMYTGRGVPPPSYSEC